MVPRLSESLLPLAATLGTFLAKLGMSDVHSCSEMRAGITGSLVSRVHAEGSVMSCVHYGYLSWLGELVTLYRDGLNSVLQVC